MIIPNIWENIKCSKPPTSHPINLNRLKPAPTHKAGNRTTKKTPEVQTIIHPKGLENNPTKLFFKKPEKNIEKKNLNIEKTGEQLHGTINISEKKLDFHEDFTYFPPKNCGKNGPLGLK